MNLFDPELQVSINKPMIKSKLKELAGELKKFKVQAILVIDYKERNNRKMNFSFHFDSDIVETLKFMHQNIMTKIKN